MFFCAGVEEVDGRLQGTFIGLLQRLDYIKAIGANVVMLRPVYATSVGTLRVSGVVCWIDGFGGV